MNPERWQKLDELFHAALVREPGARAAYIAEACAGNAELRQELESLLVHHEQAKSFIESPAYAVTAEMILDGELLPPLIGRKFGSYQVLSLLGQSGMGQVYLALDGELQRKVALKFLRSDLIGDESRMQRLRQEARAASVLNHPNIITVHQIGEVAGWQFIATEFVEGETLRQIMRNQCLPLTQALEISVQIASALSVAHAAGIIHRDIKPENVMVRPDGYVKVLDFGLAKLSQPAVVDSDAWAVVNTEEGIIAGTIQYMSPEQARGQSVDTRTDIWSFGVVLYEMLAGRAPFAGETKSAVISAILEREAPPLAHYIADLPREVQSIVSKTLKKDRVERYRNAQDLLRDLRALKQHSELEAGDHTEILKAHLPFAHKPLPAMETIADAPARPTSNAEYLVNQIKRRKTSVVAAMLTLIAAVTAIALMYLKTNRGQDKLPAHPKAMNMTRLTTSEQLQGATISPDGKYIAYVVREAACCFQQSLRLRQVDTTSDIQIDPPSTLYHQRLTFSPDQKYLYFIDNSDNLYQMPLFGGPKTKLLPQVSSPISFSPDGQRFTFIRSNYPNQDESTLMVAAADGSGEKKIASRKKPDFFDGGPSWAPMASIIACGAGSVDDRGRYMSVVEVHVDDGAQRQITSERWHNVGPVVWLSDGSGLLMLAEDQNSIFSPQIWQLSYSDGRARRLTNELNSYDGLSLSANSTIALSEQETQSSNVWSAHQAGRARAVTSGTAGSYENLSWVSNAQLIYDSNSGGQWDIWRLDLETGVRTQLTINSAANADSSVSPDRRFIVFVSNRAGPVNIWRMDLDGANPKQLTRGNNDDDYPRCTPDGKWVVYESTRSDKTTLWKAPIDGGEPIQLVDKPSQQAAISPDGKWVVYQVAGPGESTLWKVSIEGGDPVHLIDKHVVDPVISPDGKSIACRYQSDAALDQWKLAIISIEGGSLLQVFDAPAHPFWDRLYFRWSRDGRAITYRVHQRGIDRNGIDNLWNQPIDGGQPKQLTHFDSNQIFSFAWSPNGDLALSRGVEKRDVVLLTNFRLFE